jgi:hypothetical protein
MASAVRWIRVSSTGRDVDLARLLLGDDRRAARDLLDRHVQPLLGEEAVVLRNAMTGGKTGTVN